MEVDLQSHAQNRLMGLLFAVSLVKMFDSATENTVEAKTTRRWSLRPRGTSQSRNATGPKTQLIKTIGGAESKYKKRPESQCFMTHAQRGHHSTHSQAAGEAHPSIPLHLPVTSIDKSVARRGGKVLLTSAHCVTWESWRRLYWHFA